MDGLNLQGVNLEDLVRATDGDGAVFYHQAIEVMEGKMGTGSGGGLVAWD